MNLPFFSFFLKRGWAKSPKEIARKGALLTPRWVSVDKHVAYHVIPEMERGQKGSPPLCRGGEVKKESISNSGK